VEVLPDSVIGVGGFGGSGLRCDAAPGGPSGGGWVALLLGLRSLGLRTAGVRSSRPAPASRTRRSR
jgi:hypothetical protein